MRYGTEIVSFLAQKIWGISPKKIIRILNLLIFSKEKSKNGFHGNALSDLGKHITATRIYLSSKIKDTYHLLS